MIRRFAGYYKPVKKLFILDMLASLLVAGCDMFYPMLSRQFVGEYIPNGNFRAIIISSLILFILFTIKLFLKHFIQYQGHLVGLIMQANMRQELFDHILTMPFKFFDNNKTGKLMSRIVNDLQEIAELAHHGPEDFFISVILFIGSFILLCSINIILTVIVFLPIPILLIFASRQRTAMNRTMAATRVEQGEVNAGIENSVSGVRVTKSFAASEHESKKFSSNNRKFVEVREKAYKAIADFYSGTSYITDLLTLVTLVSSAIFAVNGWISSADLFAYILYIGLFMDPIKRILNLVEMYQMGATGFKRFTDFLDIPGETDNNSAKAIESVKGDIAFENVVFRYDEENLVFKDLNLSIVAGETVAFVGPSGGGKTTLCQLIPRFYDVDSGKITLDGITIEDITSKSLREHIGIVQQDTFLFAGTVKENISYGNLTASDEEIIEAAKKAKIHDYVISMPKGYDTYVGERGVKLSGGQKQRISIARIFLKNPSVLILDEATSALDNETEMHIQESLNELSKGRTTLIVAHRLSTIQQADRIFVVTEDGIIEEGTHKELLEKKGAYATLYNMQFGQDIDIG